MISKKTIQDILESLAPKEAEAARNEMRLYGSFVVLIANDGTTKRLPLQNVSWREDGAIEIRDFYVEGANWVDFITFGSIYEEQHDVSRAAGQWRHRIRAVGDEPHDPWREGRAPTVERPA